MNPVEHDRHLRNLFSGIVGRQPADLEAVAMRAARRRERLERRANAAELQTGKRAAAVERRKLNQMRAADYARDRRATGKENT